MEKALIGSILKKRISEMGYTQEEFAEIVGVRIETLKNYVQGRNYYPLDLLEVFSEKLECSYDYLLGYSKSPRRENHILAEELKLSDRAIENIKLRARHHEEYIAKRWLDTVDILISDYYLIELVTEYFTLDRPMDKKLSEEIKRIYSLEGENVSFDFNKITLIGLICSRLGELRGNDEMKEELKAILSEQK